VRDAQRVERYLDRSEHAEHHRCVDVAHVRDPERAALQITKPAAEDDAERGGAARSRYWTWAALMRRAFDLDVLRCPRCAGRRELIATIDDPAVIHRILAHLALPSARDDPESAAAVSPPREDQPALLFALP
jgi:hypothetical protein